MEKKLSHRNEYVSLKVPVDTYFLPSVISFIEKSAEIFKLDRKSIFQLTLAGDELFTYLCQHFPEGHFTEIICKDIKYSVKVEFHFIRHKMNLKMFNITSSISCKNENDIKEIGPFIASRTVDRLYITKDSEEKVTLTLYKDKIYPEVKPVILQEVENMEEFTVRETSSEDLKILLYQIKKYYCPMFYPEEFSSAGKMIDKISVGEYYGAVAVDKYERIGGGIIWQERNSKITEFFGPYLFNQSDNSPIAEELINKVIHSLAKTETFALFAKYATPELPKNYFEGLGKITIYRSLTEYLVFDTFYRQLKEEPGCHVWINSDIEHFLKKEYKRLYLARYMDTIHRTGERMPEFSVFSSELDRKYKTVIINPLVPGEDSSNNIVSHIQLFLGDGIINIFFMIDLAFSWQVDLIPYLKENNFKEKVLFPYGGKSDMVVFQYEHS